MAKDVFPMTAAGLDQLTKELQNLEDEKRAHAKGRVTHARSFCDFHEDPEYDRAVEHLAQIEERISDLKYKIKNAQLIEKTSGSYVALGSTVTFKDVDENETETYTIVGSEEADPSAGKISNQSLVAQALLGAKVNDDISIETPAGNRHVKVIKMN